jgi:hypothetical protein
MQNWMITSSVGLIFGYFTQKKMIQKSFLDHQEGFFVHWVGQFSLVILSFCLRDNSYLLLVLLMLLSFCPIAWSEVRRLIFIKNWQQNQVLFLDYIILNMKTGLSLRESVKKLWQSQKGTKQNILRYLGEMLEITGANQRPVDLPLIIKTFFEEIKIIDRNPSRKLENIIKLRSHYRMMQDFRLKADAAVMQSKAQAIVVGLMFVGCLIFSIIQNPDFIKTQAFAASLLLYGAGSFWLSKMGTRIKWKT